LLPLFTAARAKLLVNKMNTARIKPSARDRIAGYIAFIPVTALMLHCKLTILELEKALEALHCSIGRPVTLMHMHPSVLSAGRRGCRQNSAFTMPPAICGHQPLATPCGRQG
jgi:hypothetical protein